MSNIFHKVNAWRAGSNKNDSAPTKFSPLKATWAEATTRQKELNPDVTLSSLTEKRKTLEKGSNEWNKVQNQINEAYGVSKRYDVTEETPVAPPPEPVDDKTETETITGGQRTKTKIDGGHREGGTTEILREDPKGRKRRQVTKTADSKTVTRYDKEGNVKKTKTKSKNYRQRNKNEEVETDASALKQTRTTEDKSVKKGEAPEVGRVEDKSVKKGEAPEPGRIKDKSIKPGDPNYDKYVKHVKETKRNY